MQGSRSTSVAHRMLATARLFAPIVALLLAGCGGSSGPGASPPPPSPPPPPVPPSVSVSAASLAEGDSGTASMDFEVTLSAAAAGTVTVDYSTSDDTALATEDYDAASGTLSFPAGTTRLVVSVVVRGDMDIEATERFALTLSNVANATLGQANATGTIINDDGVAGGVFGLDSRPDNQSCVAPPRPVLDASVDIVNAYPALPNISLPTKLLLEPGPDPRWFVLRKSGQLVTFDPDNATSVDTFLDLSGVVRTDSEGGLLGMAFHPDYPNTPEVFLSYTINHSGPPMRSVISRFVLDDVTTPGAGTVEEIILEVDQDRDNHNGGDIAFGADGYLYIGLGDGGGSGDPLNRSQDTTYLLGSMLRIDVLSAGANPYLIPPDNPFSGNAICGPGANAADCPETYAWGLRNPWRWSFDAPTGELWLADVGQGAYEEVNRIERGGNYGWRCREGAHDFNQSGCGTGLIDPVTEYPRSQGNSITGGVVYRGTAIPELNGRYLFADYGSGRFWALEPDGQGGYRNDEIIDSSFGPTAFAHGPDGEVYFTDINSGRIRQIVPAGAGVPDTIPELLSNTGCTAPGDVTLPYAGLVPYDLNAPFWSDGATKERFIALPNGSTITRAADGDWTFPNGTVIVKNFRLAGNLVETRHLMRHPDGVWAGYTYEWNAQQTEATRVRGGKVVDVAGQMWIYPSEGECLECHTSSADFALGPETAQLNKSYTYTSTQRTANQLETLDHIMMFTAPLPGPAAGLPSMPDPADTSAAIGDRARAWLHTNCAQCHRTGGPTPSSMDLQYTTLLANTNACDAVPLEGDLGIPNARLIAPGDASRSLLVERAGRRDSHGMPPLGSTVIDTAGIGILTTWIDGLSACN